MRGQLGILIPELELNLKDEFPPLTLKMKEDAKAYDAEFGDFDVMLMGSTRRLHLLGKVFQELSLTNESPRRYDDHNNGNFNFPHISSSANSTLCPHLQGGDQWVVPICGGAGICSAQGRRGPAIRGDNKASFCSAQKGEEGP